MFFPAFFVKVSGFEPQAVLALLEAICPRLLSAARKQFGDGSQEASRPSYLLKETAEKNKYSPLLFWSECRDSNPRPLGPEPSAIPNFATPRLLRYYK